MLIHLPTCTQFGDLLCFDLKYTVRDFAVVEQPAKVEDRIQREVILSDCLLYQAALVILNQDMKSYMRGGWYIRQAWKRYCKLYHEVQQIYTARVTGISRELSTVSAVANIESSADAVISPSPSIGPEVFSLDGEVPVEEIELDFSDMRSGLGEMSKDALSRLLGAVSFGYGVFRLLVSLIPPKILWWIQFLGFDGDQDEGLACLEYCSQSADMKAPLAMYVQHLQLFCHICIKHEWHNVLVSIKQ